MQPTVGTTLDLVIIVLYFIVIMAFGSYFGKFIKGTKDFFFAGQHCSKLYSGREKKGDLMKSPFFFN